MDYKQLLEGDGHWSGSRVLLKVVNVKSSDYPANIYLDSDGNQIVASKRFSPMSVTNPMRLRAGGYYKVETQLEIVKPIPKGVTARVVSAEGIAESGLIIAADVFVEGYKGPVTFNVFCGRRISMDLGVRVAWLEFVSSNGGQEAKPTAKPKQISKAKGATS